MTVQTATDISNAARTATSARELYAITDRLARKGAHIDGLADNGYAFMRALAPMVPAVKACRRRHNGDCLRIPLKARAKCYAIMAKNGHNVREIIRSNYR